jgi:cell filamentation protein
MKHGDPYVYSNGVLINKFGIRNQDELNQREFDVVYVATKKIIRKPIKGTFDFNHFCEFHRQLFKNVYEWAGIPRTVNIEKAERVLGGLSVEYTDAFAIKGIARQVLYHLNNTDWGVLSLEEKATQLSHYMGAIWKVHAFREGNTRTTMLFFNQFANEKGFPLDYELISNNSDYVRNALVAISAVFSDLGDRSQPEHLIRIIKDSMERGA